ncbi:hypothetical protein ACIBF5_19755 [Micromonospora sp. NPDC050417]|uniref:hypothetical protein n=1 Tax=Micromonospora sp. NPDC050417 TaxID=3364280 RepID=UPI0037A75523
MTDHWDGWIEDGSGFDGGLDGDSDAVPGLAGDDYPTEGFGPADDFTGGGAGAEDPGGSPEAGPIGYGDEPFTSDTDLGYGDDPFTSDTGPGNVDADSGPGSAADPDTGLAAAEPERGLGSAEPDAEVGFGAAGPPVGADPDLGPYDDADGWPQPAFPDMFEGGVVPEPIDGWPWADPAALGHPDTVPDPAAVPAAAPDPAELAGYAAQELPPDVDPWAVLADSEDPATSALARFWGQRES